MTTLLSNRDLPQTFTNDNRTLLETFDETLASYKATETNISTAFTTQVKQNLTDWKWI